MSPEGIQTKNQPNQIYRRLTLAEVAYRGYRLNVTHTILINRRWNFNDQFYWATPTPTDLSVPAHIAGEEIAAALNTPTPPDPTNKRQVNWVAKRLAQIPGNNLELTVLRERAREALSIAATIPKPPQLTA